MAPADPAHLRPRYRGTVGPRDRAGKTILHVLPQRVIRGQLRDLRAARAALGVPLRRRRPIHDRVAARRRIAAQLPRDRRRRPTPASDPAHAHVLGVEDRDLFPLGERQIPPRHRSQRDRRHPATVAKPPDADRHGYARRPSRIFGRPPGRDCPPETLPILPPRNRRPAWRPHLPTHRTNRLLTLANTHRAPPPSRGVATTS